MKLSIITVNLNNKDGLRRTIESVVNQTFTDYEYLVIDGASTDGSVDVIREYETRITYWVSEPDKGIYNAMNKGILLAKGEYCLFLNSGDWFLKKDLLKIVFDIYYEEDIISCHLEHEKNFTNRGLIQKKENELIYFSDFFRASLPHPSTFIKRNLLINLGMYDEQFKFVSDWIFFISAIINHHATYCFRNIELTGREENGKTSIFMKDMLNERKIYLEKSFKCFLKDYEELTLYKSSRTLSFFKNVLFKIHH